MSELPKSEPEMTALLKSTKKNMGKKILLAAVAVVLLAVAIGAGIYNTPANRLTRHLDLGQKYLEDCDYEAAIVAFQNAIAIDDRCEEGYLGLAEAYVQVEQYEQAAETYEALLEIAPTNVEGYLGLADIYLDKGEIEQALDTLDKGYELTEDKVLQDKIAQCLATYVEENREILDKLLQAAGSKSAYASYLTDEQFRELYMPYLPILERYLECDDEYDVLVLAMRLAEYYLALGEYEKCLEVRRQAYERTGNDTINIKPEETERVNDSISDVYDKYGRMLLRVESVARESGGSILPKYTEYIEYNDEKRERTILTDKHFEDGQSSLSYQDENGELVEYFLDMCSYEKCDAEGRRCEWIIEYYHDDTDILVWRSCTTYEYKGDRVVAYDCLEYAEERYLSSTGWPGDNQQEGIIDEYGEVTWLDE